MTRDTSTEETLCEALQIIQSQLDGRCNQVMALQEQFSNHLHFKKLKCWKNCRDLKSFHMFARARIISEILTIWLLSFFCYPPVGMEIICYMPSPSMEFFLCLLFDTDFFLWYSCFLGWELKPCPDLQYRVSAYT